jgi:xanthine dehydrogenase accessory factor
VTLGTRPIDRRGQDKESPVRDELEALRRWQRSGAPFVLATVVRTSSSAPRPAGAVLALHPDGSIVGNVSGGCVEPAVVELGGEVQRTGQPTLRRFGYSDDEALAVGLTCGGSLEVFIRRVDAERLPLEPVARALAADEPVAVVTVVDHPTEPWLVGAAIAITRDGEVTGSYATTPLGKVAQRAGSAALEHGGVQLRRIGSSGEWLHDDVTVLIEAFSPRPHLLVFGAIDFAAAVASLGRFLGYRVTVCDARARFATRERFPDADEVVVDWPHRHLASIPVDATTAICVLTHDAKFDVPVLVEALAGPAGFIGAMGSRRTHEDRLARLREAGVTEDALARLRSPIGLDLGGATPQETAVSIAAELIAHRHGGSGRPLTGLDAPIHRTVRSTS